MCEPAAAPLSRSKGVVEVKRTLLAGVALAATLLPVPLPARAQGAFPRRPYPGVAQPNTAPGAVPRSGALPPGSYLREVPPLPLQPNSLGLLERDFQQMRATSPNPNAFLYGRWNPGYEVVTPSPGGYYTP